MPCSHPTIRHPPAASACGCRPETLSAPHAARPIGLTSCGLCDRSLLFSAVLFSHEQDPRFLQPLRRCLPWALIVAIPVLCSARTASAGARYMPPLLSCFRCRSAAVSRGGTDRRFSLPEASRRMCFRQHMRLVGGGRHFAWWMRPVSVEAGTEDTQRFKASSASET